MNINELKDYKLTLDEWNLIPGILAGHMTYERELAHVEMLVLAGLVSRDEPDRVPVLTNEGVDAARAIDLIFDWDDFAHVEGAESPSDGEDMVFLDGEPIKRCDAMAEVLARPERMTVGSLVRHTTTGGIGLITHHTMWDADWGAFRVEFCGPVDNVIEGRVVNQLREITDRADHFEAV